MGQQDVSVSLSRDLNLFDITMIGIAGMIGAGIFALTGIAAGVAGPAVMLAFLLNGIIATFTGLAYAELGSAIPEAGGSYIWVKEAMGDHFGFLAGWCDWAAHTIACSLYAVTFGAFLSEYIVRIVGFTAIPQMTLLNISALLIVSFLTYVNYIGAKESGRLGGFVTIFKVAILVVFAAFGIYKTFLNPSWIAAYTTPSFLPNGFAGLLAAMGLTFIAFEGYEIIVQSGEEVKKPDRNIPRAIIISLWTAVVIYIVVAFSLLGSVEAETPSWIYLGTLGEFSLIRVADGIMPFGALLIIVGGLVSTVSAMNATIYSSSRVSFALGRIGYLPANLARINEKTRTPHYSIFFSFLIIAAMTLAPIEAVASAASIMFLILFIMVSYVLILLRFRRPDLNRAFKMPLVPYLPVVAIITQIVIGYFLVTEVKHGELALTVAIGWIIFGTMVYFAYSEKEKKGRIAEETRTVYGHVPLEKSEYTIMVLVANPEFAEELASFANLLARQRGGEVMLLNVIKLPRQTPYSVASNYVEDSREFMNRVREKLDVPSGCYIKIGHDVSEAILNAVEEIDPDLIVLGWRGRTYRRDRVLGSTIDPLMLKANRDTVVIRFGKDWKQKERKEIDSILIPTIGGPHAALATEIARDIHKQQNSAITLMNVGKRKEDEKRANQVFDKAKKILDDIEFERKFFVSNDVAEEISREAPNHDLILIGATEESFLSTFLRGVFPEKVVQKTSKSVAMTRKWVKIRDFLKQ
ncbi:MAG: amino acid permease [Archaeoglobaceae archaeon]